MARFFPKRCAQAMTLIELIVVTVIIASIAGAGILSLSMLEGKRLEADTRRLVADLSLARELAANTRTNYIVDFDTANETYVVYRGSVLASNEILRQRLQVDLASVAPGSQMTFSSPSGTTTTTTITLNRNGRTRQVLVTGATGYVRM